MEETAATASSILGPGPPSHLASPLLSDPDSSPVGSPVEMIPDEMRLLSDEDQERDQDRNRQPGDHSSGPDVLTDDLKHKIIKQVEYYFGDENLPKDNYLLNFIKKNKAGFVPISVIASFRKIKKLTRDNQAILAALKESSLLVVSSDGKKVKRLNPLPLPEVRDPQLFTVLVENLPEDHSIENIRKIFGEAGKIKNISIGDPQAMESKKGTKKDMLISNKLHALVEYETVEEAEKAVGTLNNEQDWRNGLRVKLLKRLVNYANKRQGWRASDSEKNCAGRIPEPTVAEKNNIIGEHSNDKPDEECGDHIHKEKNGQRGKNRGRSRGQKYRPSNGLGHGNASSHVGEAFKAPPGPKMPDGTKGFTMGRGRPVNSDQN